MSLVFGLNIVIWIHGPWSTPTQPRYSWENNSWLFQSYQLEDNYHQSAALWLGGGKGANEYAFREGSPTNRSAHPSIHPPLRTQTDYCRKTHLTTHKVYKIIFFLNYVT